MPDAELWRPRYFKVRNRRVAALGGDTGFDRLPGEVEIDKTTPTELDFDGRGYNAKLVPQPHDAVAFGLLTLNDEPIRSSTKSISDPAI